MAIHVPAHSSASRKDTAPDSRQRSVANTLLLLASLAAGVLICEVVLRTVHPLSDPYWRFKIRPDHAAAYIPSQFPPHLALELRTEAGLRGMEERARFTINNAGLRGDSLAMPKPLDEYRIFIVGGSTTECLYLDDTRAFTRQVQDTLTQLYPGRNIRVYGAGKSGDKSYDHISMIAHRLVRLQPDMIVVFAGVNDLMASVNGRDYLFFPSGASRSWNLAELLRFSATELQVARLAFGALKPSQYRDAVEEIRMNSAIQRSATLRRRLALSQVPPALNLAPYEQNLRSIVALAGGHGAELVFMTQASTWNSAVDPEAETWHWMNAAAGYAFSEASMDAALETYNDVMRGVAASHNVPLLDFSAIIPKSLDYFYDDVHFNVRGAATAGGELARFLAAHEIVGRESN